MRKQTINSVVAELHAIVLDALQVEGLTRSALPSDDAQAVMFDTKDSKLKVAVGRYDQWETITINLVFEQRKGVWFRVGDFVGPVDRCAQGNEIMERYGFSDCSERFDGRYTDVWNNESAVIATIQEWAAKLAH